MKDIYPKGIKDHLRQFPPDHTEVIVSFRIHEALKLILGSNQKINPISNAHKMNFHIVLDRITYKHKIPLVLILLLCSFNLVFSQASIRVISYNIWDPADIPFWDKYGKGYPVDQVVEYLTSENPDMILLQEVTLEKPPHSQSYRNIKRKLEDKGYSFSAFYRPGTSGRVGYVPGALNSGYPLAIFSKLPIEETYSIQADSGITMGKGVLGVKIRLNNHPVYIFNTHLSIGNSTTSKEVKNVALPFVEMIVENGRVIFGGDWNSPPAAEYPNSSQKIGDYIYSSETTQFLLDAGFKDVWMALSPDRKKGNGITCPGQDDYIKRVDQIYYRGEGIHPVYIGSKLNLWKQYGLKDHNAVVSDFEIYQ